jgi:predicted nucleotidyltransferase
MVNNEVREVLKKVCTCLAEHSVDYIIVGGVAVAVHGFQRMSGIQTIRPEIKVDVDFWYRPTLNNFLKLTKALIELGVNREDLESIVFHPDRTFLKISHDKFHTDFLCQMKGLDSFDECKKTAATINIDGYTLRVLGYEDLMKNKRAVNRQIDRDDIENLERDR